MEAEGRNNPPFWAEPAYNQRRHSRHSRRYGVGMSTFILSPMALVPALLVAVVLISYIPSLLSPFSLLLRRVLLFKPWDAFNLLLVLFAILAGILSRNSSATGSGHHQQEEGDQFASKLFEFAGNPDNARIQREDEGQEFPSRFYESKLDESSLLMKEVTPRSKEVWFSGDHNGQKSEGLDSMGDRSLLKTPQSKAAILFHDNNDQKNERLDPMSDQSPVESPRRDSRIPDFERFASRDDALMRRTHSFSPPPTSPQLPLPPPPQPRAAEEKVKKYKHRSKDASMAFASVSSRKKDRKKKNKSSEHVAAEIPALLPEPRPPSIFHHLFSNPKETKIEKPRVHSAPVSIPPPSTPLHLAPTKKREKPRRENVGIQDSDSPVAFPPLLPPLPSPVIRVKEKHKMEISSISSSSSGRSLPPLLPPPPPPPLGSERRAERVILTENKYVTKRSDWKRECQAGKSENVSGTSLFCPSSDVNVKADKFIAKVREGMMLEKIQAMREKKQRHAKR